LEELLTHAEATRSLFQPHPSIPDAYLLSWRGEPVSVTFSPACVDAHPNTVQFLTYGSALFDEILAGVPQPDADAAFGLVRCEAEGDLRLRGWYMSNPDGSPARPLPTFAALRDWLKDNPPGQREAVQSFLDGAKSAFASEIVDLRRRQAEIIAARRRAGYLALRARAQLILLRAASVELALGQSPDFFDETYPTAFNDQAVCGLQRHGYPWGALLKLAFEPGLAPRQEDPYFVHIAEEKRDALKGRFAQLKDEARKIVGPLQAALKTAGEPSGGTPDLRAAVF
jgi:hypothetical protein